MTEFRLPERAATWVFAGDSITQGIFHTHGARCWVEHVQERVRWQLDRLEDLVVNAGVSGWRAPHMVAAFDWFIARHRPDVVSIAFGANDALAGVEGLNAFSSAMRELVTRARDLTNDVVLHTPNLVTQGSPLRFAHIAAYAEAVREVAATSGSRLVDHAAHWTEHFGDNEPIAWLDDHTHPNAAGHLAMADLTLRTLGLGELEQPI